MRALIRGRHGGIDPSHPDYQAFELDRYAEYQRREIIKLTARQTVISRVDIADALERADRKARQGRQLTGVAVGAGFVAMFGLGFLVARYDTAPAGEADHASAASPSPQPQDADGHWSPGGFDKADREFFADLQAGRINTSIVPPKPRSQPTPVAAPTVRPVVTAATAPAAQPAAGPASAPDDMIIQLGAFADAAVARARWQQLTTRFAALRPLALNVAPIAVGGRTLYRLQARGAGAASVCPSLAGGGQACVIIGPGPTPQPVLAPSAPAGAPPSATQAVARGETVIQLGAFTNAAVAKARWQALSAKFPALRPLTQTVSSVARGGRTIYRLRASGADAASACSKMAGAGAICFVTTDKS